MLSKSTRPNSASRGRRSFSDGGLFADVAGIIHIRIPHVRRYGSRRSPSTRYSAVSLHCEEDGPHVGEITAVPARVKAFPTCVRCLGKELDDDT